MKKIVPESLNEYNQEFTRGDDNPLDTLKIGNRPRRLKGMGESMPLFTYIFNADDDIDSGDYEEEFPEIYKIARAKFLENLDFAAVLDYMREEEGLPSWEDIDEYGTMGDVIDEWDEEADSETFREWALSVVEFLSDNYGFNPEKYEELINNL